MERLTLSSKFNHVENGVWLLDKKGMPRTLITDADDEYVYIKKLAEYEDLEEQGKLPKLPCAVGDTMYTNLSMQWWRFKKKDRPYKVKVVFIGINGVDNCMHVAFDNGYMFQFWFSDIGKTIFLTKESAEAALKEMSE